jgi:hypothetical protein
MKTIYDLLNLISEELKLSEDMLHKYTFDIHLKHGWVSMYEHTDYSELREKTIFSLKSIKTEGELQEVYWTIYNNGRSSKRG